MGITEQQVNKLAQLCKLKFSDKELSVITDRINKVVKDTEKIQAINLKEHIEINHPKIAMRADLVKSSFEAEQALANSSNIKDDYITVPPVIGK